MHDEGLSTEPDDDLLDLADNAATALPEPVASAARPDDDHTLDFDLGGLGFEPMSMDPPPAAPAAAPAAVASPAADPNDLAFTSEPIAAAAAPSEEEQSFDLAFDMDFDTPAAITPAVEPKSLDDISLDLHSNAASSDFNMAGMAHEFDLPKLPESAAPAPVADSMAGLDAMNFDLPAAASVPADDPFALPDLPSAPPAAPASYAAAPQFDMTSIDLDLPAGESDDKGLEEMAMASSDQADMSASHMEMETKLDLAIAYQEIGDKEGARELLDEVIKGGSREQVSKANDMRAKLA
jgi:pilus assembly protein FimV